MEDTPREAAFRREVREWLSKYAAPRSVMFQNAYLQSPGLRIAGGTDEIMRNIVAERVLGLPQDIRADKGIPFNELRSSGA